MNYALITGASSGMGLEFAKQLAAKGYGIIIVSNRPEENHQAANLIKTKYNVSTYEINMDLTLSTAAQTIFEQVRQWNLDVEILISNAGMLLFSTIDRTTPEALDKIITLHCTTPAQLIQMFGHEMVKRKHGYILIVSSSTAWMQFPTIAHYGATKAFLKNFSRSIWYEYRRDGIGVTALFPGAVDTPLYDLDEKHRRLFRKLGMMIRPERAVSIALRSMFKKRYRCIPGLFTKFTVVLCACLPASLFGLLLKIPPVKRLLDRV